MNYTTIRNYRNQNPIYHIIYTIIEKIEMFTDNKHET